MQKTITDKELEEFQDIFYHIIDDPSIWETKLKPFLDLDIDNTNFELDSQDLKIEAQRDFTRLFRRVLTHGDKYAPLAQKLMRQFKKLRPIVKGPDEYDFPVWFQDFEAYYYGLEQEVDNLEAFKKVATLLKKHRDGLKSDPENSV